MKHFFRTCCILSILIYSVSVNAQKIEGLALTPPMGWNSWNTFQTKISEQLVEEMADKMVSSGMLAAGYNYLVLDDGWMSMQRDTSGNLVADPVKFPHGMKVVADYVHGKGLKFGLYNCAGSKTCAGYPGTRGFEFQDARMYAALGIDYLKFDWCNAELQNARESYTLMSKALAKTGHPIVFSLCEWGTAKPWHWAEHVGHLWRTTGDIGMVFDGSRKLGNWTPMSAMHIVDIEDSLRSFAGPGHWNDPDMLEVGNGYTPAEDRAHFTMWCMLAAPLMAGNDLRKMSAQTNALLANKNLIAVDQDKLGIQGFRVSRSDSLEVWAKPLEKGSWAITFLNRSKDARKADLNWDEIKISDPLSHLALNTGAGIYTLKNLWTNSAMGTTKTRFRATIPSHDVLVLRVEMQ